MYYIFSSSFYISAGVFFVCLIFIKVYGKNKVVKGFLIFSALSFLFAIIYPNFVPYGGGPHYNCNSKFEREAQNIAAAVSNYFAEPSRTQVPNYSDLALSEEYIENKNLKRRDKLIKESGYSVDILDDKFGGITIVLSCKKGKCPFNRWKCPRPYKGGIYVLSMGGNGANGWLDSREDL